MEDELIKDIKTFSSKKLCTFIITNRIFNLNPTLARLAMEELALRRSSGDLFEFENYIETNLKQFPSLTQKLDVSSILKGMKNG